MKHKTLVLAAMILATLPAMAQHDEGDMLVTPRVGLNVATLSDADKPIAHVHLGVEAEYMVSDRFSLGFGALASNQGGKYDNDVDGTGEIDLDYVQVPLLGSYYLLPGLAVKAGVQPGFRIRAKAKTDGGTIDLDRFYQITRPIIGDEAKVNNFDLSIPVGIAYEYKNIVLDARYNFGLLKVVSAADAFYNRCFMLSLGYKIELDM